jgi:N-methylhydantoinase A
MEEQARRDLAAERVKDSEMEVRRFADMRYMGQEHTVKVQLPAGEITAGVMPEINEGFHTLHEQSYTFRLDTPVELVNFHVTALGRVTKPEVKRLADGPPLGTGAAQVLDDTNTDRSPAGKGTRVLPSRVRLWSKNRPRPRWSSLTRN